MTLYGFKNTAAHIFFHWCGLSIKDQAFKADLAVFLAEHQTRRQILFKARLHDDISVQLIPMLWFE